MSRTSEMPAEIHGFSVAGAAPTPWKTALEQVSATAGPGERKARNLADNPAVVLTTGRSDRSGEGLEGHAERVIHPERLHAVTGRVQDRRVAFRGPRRRFRPRRGLWSRAGVLGAVSAPQGRALQSDDLDVLVVMALQEPVQAAIDALVASGAETGLQVAVLHAGHVVADAVAGIADERTGAPVEPGTLFFAASVGKGVAASVAHVLVEHVELD